MVWSRVDGQWTDGYSRSGSSIETRSRRAGRNGPWHNIRDEKSELKIMVRLSTGLCFGPLSEQSLCTQAIRGREKKGSQAVVPLFVARPTFRTTSSATVASETFVRRRRAERSVLSTLFLTPGNIWCVYSRREPRGRVQFSRNSSESSRRYSSRRRSETVPISPRGIL